MCRLFGDRDFRHDWGDRAIVRPLPAESEQAIDGSDGLNTDLGKNDQLLWVPWTERRTGRNESSGIQTAEFRVARTCDVN